MLNFQQEYDNRIRQNDSNSYIQEQERFYENINTLDKEAQAEIKSVYNVVKKWNYKHPGPYANYINHILRMCNLYFELCTSLKTDIIITILAHNAFEVTDISSEELSGLIGTQLAKAIEALKVDRSIEWNQDYKSTYYHDISKNKICLCVKIIDKIDNLFLIGTNPDRSTREKYLNEIINYVIPLSANQPYIIDSDTILISIAKEVVNTEGVMGDLS